MLHQTPKHYRAAITSTDHWYWRAAITKELQAITDAGVYELVPASSLPAGTNVIGYTWVFRIKQNEDGSVARYKARLCCDGSRQKAGVDYGADKLYAPVANATTIRLVLAIATAQKMLVRQYDIEVAFLAADIDKPVYMRVPSGAETKTNHVWRLRRSLYGLKQAPRLFNDHLTKSLLAMKYHQSECDPCLFYKKGAGKLFTLLAVVVDDLLLSSKLFSERSTS